MSDQDNNNQPNPWVKEQYQNATKFLAEKGIVADSVILEESRIIDGLLAVWKLNTLDKQTYWVVCGDVPTDHAEVSVAANARESLRHFSLKWQLQADGLLSQEDKTQHDFANYLISRAEGLYQMHEKEDLWR